MAASKSSRKIVYSASALALALTVAGCKPVGPDYQRPAYTAPSAYKETGAANITVPPPPAPNGGSWQTANPSDGMLKGKWWEIYNDPQLNKFEDRIATVNQNLHQALETYLAAREQVKIARSAFYPSLSAGPGFNHAKVSQNRPLVLPPQNSVVTSYNDLTLEGQASWEPDFWGAIRRTVESARAAAQASNADMANVELSLESEMAEDYFELRGLDLQTQLLTNDIDDLTNQLNLTKRRLKGGVATDVDVAQAQTQLDQTRAQLIDVGVARAEFEHAIASIAEYDLSGFSIPPAPLVLNPDPAQPNQDLPKIPLGVPSQLLQRRPDIASAERRAAQANAQIGVATAAFYPTITLGGGGGFESTHGGTWIQGPSSLWSLGAQASELLFDAGRRKATTQQARDLFESSASNYKNVVFLAFGEVEDKLSDLRILEQEESAQREAVFDAQHSLDLSNKRYKGGATSYLEVLTAEATLIQNQRTQATLRSRRFASSVELIRSLGGGWDASQIPK
ncbi:efflux transporter outer membrane subunit [Acidicapsa dinghuensis]|uniref:Efflux transporter outer membrane subunit n=1 Tax=Acidicapsa dinghuensis TaxID=2218256 RepID=A0ABW1EGG4_9BACT|nr:efflux transporter outer membrane subunit [Acidicapsa dinghuensis]